MNHLLNENYQQLHCRKAMLEIRVIDLYSDLIILINENLDHNPK